MQIVTKRSWILLFANQVFIRRSLSWLEIAHKRSLWNYIHSGDFDSKFERMDNRLGEIAFGNWLDDGLYIVKFTTRLASGKRISS